MIIFYKNLFKFFALFSLIVGQELKDIDTKLSNLEFEQVQLPLEQLNSKYPENSDILLRLSITHHYLSESAIEKSEDKKNALKAFKYIEQANDIDPDNPNILKWYVITLGKTVEEDTIRNQIEEHINKSEDFNTSVGVAVRVDKFSDSSIDMYVRCFTKTDSWNDWLSVKERLAIAIKQIVENNKASFAFPSQSIYVEKK